MSDAEGGHAISEPVGVLQGTLNTCTNTLSAARGSCHSSNWHGPFVTGVADVSRATHGSAPEGSASQSIYEG